MGLGPAAGRTAVSLSQARVKAQELHAAVREGRDPPTERKAEKAQAETDAAKAKAVGMTFEVADMYSRRMKPAGAAPGIGGNGATPCATRCCPRSASCPSAASIPARW